MFKNPSELAENILTFTTTQQSFQVQILPRRDFKKIYLALKTKKKTEKNNEN